MNLYFYSNTQNCNTEQNLYSVILYHCQANGICLLYNKDKHGLMDFSKKNQSYNYNKAMMTIDYMDGFIIEHGEPTDEMGYLISFAISRKKPLLYLLPNNTKKKENSLLDYLIYEKEKNILIKIMEYTQDQIRERIDDFIEFIESEEGQNPQLIKFTLRLTPRLNTKFTQKCNTEKKHKAELLREIITRYVAEKIENTKLDKKNSHIG